MIHLFVELLTLLMKQERLHSYLFPLFTALTSKEQQILHEKADFVVIGEMLRALTVTVKQKIGNPKISGVRSAPILLPSTKKCSKNNQFRKNSARLKS